MKGMKSETCKGMLREIPGDFAGALLYAVGIYCFAMPADFATGGVSGAALILRHVAEIPMGQITILLNIPMILLSLRGSWKTVSDFIHQIYADFFCGVGCSRAAVSVVYGKSHSGSSVYRRVYRPWFGAGVPAGRLHWWNGFFGDDTETSASPFFHRPGDTGSGWSGDFKRRAGVSKCGCQ